jgi:diguanylate cyclase (GGDEF)-like protein
MQDDTGHVTHYIGIIQDITERKESEETIYNLAFYDPLTHLPNRHLLLDRLQQIVLSCVRKKRFGAILFIDLDDFKTLNDTKGREIGDILLMEIAKRLQSSTHKDDTVARIGGDEFVIVLDTLDAERKQAATEAQTVAERIIATIKQPQCLKGQEYHCSASIGIALFHEQKITVEELLNHAESAVHQAKQQGRNAIRFFDPTIQAALESRVQMESWMRQALNEQYALYYQAQVDIDGNIIGAEVLIRWLHPDRGIINPSEFIPLAEKTGLILPIGQWVLETACIQLKVWEQDKKTRHLMLSVNVSAKQFHQPDFVEQVMVVLDRTDAYPYKLKLEVTESMLIDDIEIVIDKMTALKNRGVKFSLDDFGTGFSSLAYLKRLPFNQLKIDQSFVREALTDPNDAAITRTVIALAQSMRMEVIAEGVETEAHRNFLAVNGCHLYQGYLFSKPVPLNEFEKLLKLT